MGGGSGNPQIDDLVAAQKEIIVATWKLDRRSRGAQGAKSEQDIRAVGKAEAELKTRVEQTVELVPRRRPCAIRAGAARRRRGRRGSPLPPSPPAPGTARAGQPMPEEDAMTLASEAMGKAVTSLDALKTPRRCRTKSRRSTPAEGAGGRQEAAGSAAAGGQRSRRQPGDSGPVEPVRQGARQEPADQLRDANQHRAERRQQGEPARQDQGARAAAGRTGEAASRSLPAIAAR